MRVKAIVAAALVAVVLALAAAPAGAWHATVFGRYQCEEHQRVITWSVTNSERVAGTFTWSLTPGSQTGSGVLKANKGYVTFKTVVPADGSYTMNVVPSWPGNEEHPLATFTVAVGGECYPPTTTTEPPPSTTVPPPSSSTTVPPTTVTTTLPPSTTVPPSSSTTVLSAPSTTVMPVEPSAESFTTAELAFTGISSTQLFLLSGLLGIALGLLLSRAARRTVLKQ